MKEPTRLSETSGLARALLQSARGDIAPAASRRRAMAVTSVAASAASATKALSAAAAVTKGVLPWVVPVLIGTAAVTAGVVATRGRTPAEESAPRSMSSSAAARTIASSGLASAPPIETHPPARYEAPLPSLPSSAIARPVVPPARTQPATEQAREISGELRLLDAANRALAEGDLAAANANLDGYARDYPKGTLAEEALAIRVRVWARSGDRDRAQALYERLAKAYPASPYLDSLREALGPPPAREIRSPSP